MDIALPYPPAANMFEQGRVSGLILARLRFTGHRLCHLRPTVCHESAAWSPPAGE
ncbi:hypothetical protein OG331_46750 [Streptomyces sp. NBC_01017]|uniref:hypothetical protein n=1 Tax=Streptomyces sp. NBC_01017 TaxID=2903721 RepID=UPI0038689DC4|nr:hypothetical protein OG331_46750 [Streptomyces sp. NBC_01017]